MKAPLPTTQPTRGPWAWRDYLPADRDELDELRRRVLATDVSPSIANAFIGWAWGEMEGDAPPLSHQTLPKYRRLLAELVAERPLTPRGRRRAKRDRDAGRAELATVTALAGAGAVVALDPHAAALVVAAVALAIGGLTPRILDSVNLQVELVAAA